MSEDPMLLRVVFILASTLALLLPSYAQHSSLHEIGIVLLHGKGGKPGSLAGLANKLQSEGMKVVIPTMAWSGHGGEPDEYGLTYENALQDIEGSIQNFKSRGLSKIVLAGHSLGANAAIAFGTNPNLYAIIALAPGHFPERMHGPDIQNKLDEARMKIAAGQGKSQTIFPRKLSRMVFIF
jgi:esterase/lipase